MIMSRQSVHFFSGCSCFGHQACYVLANSALFAKILISATKYTYVMAVSELFTDVHVSDSKHDDVLAVSAQLVEVPVFDAQRDMPWQSVHCC